MPLPLATASSRLDLVLTLALDSHIVHRRAPQEPHPCRHPAPRRCSLTSAPTPSPPRMAIATMLEKAASMHKKLSAKSAANTHKKGKSPEGGKSPEADRNRAKWTTGLEKGLVDLLLEHNNVCYKGQNGWSLEAWNIIYRLFKERFPYVPFTRVQVTDKERELKKDCMVLKEIRKQSGVSWKERLCRIEADEPLWDNIITTFGEKAKKFWTKAFPFYEAMGELHDGQTAKGTLNFTSIEPSQAAVRQPSQAAATQPSEAAATQPFEAVVTQPSQAAVTQPSQDPATHRQPSQASATQAISDDDDELRILDPPASTSMGKRGRSAASSRVDKRKQDGRVAEMMSRFLEMKAKQPQDEAKERERTNANEIDFPIPMCITVVDGMEKTLRR
ncbi:hypothetical protein BS78_K110600 [Paspalum vaginatum]|uniref:Myb/SANT-like domain-containing protein n=1 Tax=Paspalum vaginatum TaxID=158149 RepID=A0A9W8CCJ2_9POAL|nr:hypothetical protein BS78_K110600 [Paspalum vaginatum]